VVVTLFFGHWHGEQFTVGNCTDEWNPLAEPVPQILQHVSLEFDMWRYSRNQRKAAVTAITYDVLWQPF
jgi:hypothetical protein